MRTESLGVLFIDNYHVLFVRKYALSIVDIIIEDSNLENLPENMKKSALSSTIWSDKDIYIIIFPIIKFYPFMGGKISLIRITQEIGYPDIRQLHEVCGEV